MPSVSIALWTYLIPMFQARAMRILAIVLPILLGLVLAGYYSQILPSYTLTSLRRLVVAPGVALVAVLLAEMPLRDGIRQRTLLYPLLGPATRTTLALVRTMATTLVLAAGATALALFLGVLDHAPAGEMARAVEAVLLGSAAYTAFFGLIHLLTRRGLIAGLVIYGLVDEQLGRVPLGIRKIAPSVHLRAVADQIETFRVPVQFGGSHEPSVVLAVSVLVALAVLCLAAIAVLFSRRNLGELC